MEFTNNRIITSVGYSFAFAALCGMALFPQAALADDDASDAPTSAAASAQTGKRTYAAPVADEKSETVYIFAKPDGSVKSTEVSTTLKNSTGEGSLADSSVLTDIENTEGENTYSGTGDGMVWDTAGKNVYYTGKTDKQAPVSVKVTYYLDGKEVPYDKLAGASGKLKIRYDYVNDATVKATIKGKEETLYVPFTFVTALMFDNENFKNAEVTNGKLIDDGDRAIVAGYAIPGLQKSLGKLVEDFDIPDYFEVMADVTDFDMKTSLTIATAGLLSDLNTDEIDTEELRDASGELNDAMDQILDGTGTLKDGLDKLADGAKSASVAAGKLADGAGSVADGAGELAKGTGKLSKGAGDLADGTGALSKGATELADGAGKLAAGADELAKGTGTLASTIKETDMVGGIEQLYKGADELKGGLGVLAGSEDDTQGSLFAAKNGAIALSNGARQLMDGSQQVIDAIGSESDTGTSTINGALNTAKTLLGSGKNEDLEKALKTLQEAAGTLETLSGDAQGAAGALQDLGSTLQSVDLGAAKEGLTQVITSTRTASGKLDKAAAVELEADVDTDAIEDAIDGITVSGLDDDQKAELASAKESAKDAVSADGMVSGAEEIKGLIASAKDDVDAADAAASQVAEGLGALDLEATMTAVQKAAGSFQSAAEALSADAEPLKGIDSDVLVNYETARQVIQGVQDGVNQIRGSESSASGMYAAKAGASQLVDGSMALSNGIGDAITGIEQQLIPGMSQIVGGLKSLFDSTPALVEGIGKIDAGAGELAKGTGTLGSGADELAKGAGQLDEGASTLAKGTDDLDAGAGKLAKGADELADGAKEFDEGLKALPEGAGAAADGAGQLLDGLGEFKEEGIGKITDIIDDDLLPFVDRLEALKDAANEYNNFAGITKGTSGSVKFIIETDAISSED